MVQVEVEHRGSLSEVKFQKLNKFLRKDGKFLEEKDRFSIAYSPRGKETLILHKSPIDLRVRITNKKSELILKYGKWGGNDARKEFSFPIDSEKFEEAIEFLQILGYYYGILQATKTYLYLYKGVEFALVKVPDWGYYFEAEIATDSKSVESANEKIVSICQELNLDILNYKDFCELCENLNERPGFRFNFKKQKFSDIKKKFLNYF